MFSYENMKYREKTLPNILLRFSCKLVKYISAMYPFFVVDDQPSYSPYFTSLKAGLSLE